MKTTANIARAAAILLSGVLAVGAYGASGSKTPGESSGDKEYSVTKEKDEKEVKDKYGIPTISIPEPATLALFFAGLGIIGFRIIRRRMRSSRRT